MLIVMHYKDARKPGCACVISQQTRALQALCFTIHISDVRAAILVSQNKTAAMLIS